ncbi:MAG: hypothetical protein Q4C34_03460 [Bacteroidales bacterium]|nr:hypothetical protein [Bacteroidales bacterium]
MATISHSDTVFASASVRGIEFCNLQGTGFTGFGDIIDRVRRHPQARPGMIMLTVRNSSQGWSHTRAFYLTA